MEKMHYCKAEPERHEDILAGADFCVIRDTETNQAFLTIRELLDIDPATGCPYFTDTYQLPITYCPFCGRKLC